MSHASSSSQMGSGSRQPSQPHRPSSAALPSPTPGPPRSYINTFMTPPSNQQQQFAYLDGNSYPVMATTSHTPQRVASPARPPVRPTPNYGHVQQQYMSLPPHSPTLHPPTRFVNPYDSIQSASVSAPSLPHVLASESLHGQHANYSQQSGPSRSPALFGPGDPLNNRSHTPSLPPQSRPQPPQRLASAPNSTFTASSRMASNSGQALPSAQPLGPAYSRTPSGSTQGAIERHPRSNDRLASTSTLPASRSQPSESGHAFDDCEGCRAELEDAIKASLQSAQDEQSNRAQMDQEREQLDHLYAVTSLENAAQVKRDEEEEQMLQQVIASSKRDAELQAQRNAEHESLILEESLQHALRQQEKQAKEEQRMLEAAKAESRAEEEKRRQAISTIQNAEKRALEESLREQEQEWLRRESAEQSLLAFFQQRDASSPSTSQIAPPCPPKPTPRPVALQSSSSLHLQADHTPSRNHSPLPSLPQDNEAGIEAEYWKFAGHDGAYRLALQMNKFSLNQTLPDQVQPVAGPSRSSRPLPAPPASAALPPQHSKAVEASLHHVLSDDDGFLSDVPPPAYEEATSVDRPPTHSSTSSTAVKGQISGTSSPANGQIVVPTPHRPMPQLPQLMSVTSSDAGKRPQATLSPIVEVSSAGSSVITVISASEGRCTPQHIGLGKPMPTPESNGEFTTPVSSKRKSSLTMNSLPAESPRSNPVDASSPLTAGASSDPPVSPDLESPSETRADTLLLQVPERGSSTSISSLAPSNRSSMSSLAIEPKTQAAIAGIDFGFSALPFATKLDKAVTATGKPGFPATIRLSSFGAVSRRLSTESTRSLESEPRSAPFFVIRAHSWNSLLRAIAWYGNSRVEGGSDEAAATKCELRAEIEFVTPARMDTGYGVGDYARYAQSTGAMPKSQSPAHVSLCMSLNPMPSTSQTAGSVSTAQAYLKSDEYQTAKRESKRLDAWYAGKGSTRRLIQLSRLPPTLPMAFVQVAQHLHAAHTFSAACPSSGSTARHSPRDLHHAIERHDQDFIRKQKAMLAASAVLNNHSAGGSSASLIPTTSRSGDHNDADNDDDDNDDDDLDFNDFTLLENGLAGNGSFDAQDQELMGKRARLKAKVKRRLAKRNSDGRVVDEDLATWITPFDLSQHS